MELLCALLEGCWVFLPPGGFVHASHMHLLWRAVDDDVLVGSIFFACGCPDGAQRCEGPSEERPDLLTDVFTWILGRGQRDICHRPAVGS